MILINEKEVVGSEFAYDGCHKIYVLENEDDKNEALEFGYEILSIGLIEETYEDSCFLKFIQNWGLDKNYVNQFEDAFFSNN